MIIVFNIHTAQCNNHTELDSPTLSLAVPLMFPEPPAHSERVTLFTANRTSSFEQQITISTNQLTPPWTKSIGSRSSSRMTAWQQLISYRRVPTLRRDRHNIQHYVLKLDISYCWALPQHKHLLFNQNKKSCCIHMIHTDWIGDVAC